MPTSNSTTVPTEQTDDDMELPVEEVAERLGLPVGMLVRRIEAGDIPARRIDDDEGAHYRVRIADLGASTRHVLPRREPPGEAKRNGTAHVAAAAAEEKRATTEPAAAVIGGPATRARRIAQLERGDSGDASPAPPPQRPRTDVVQSDIVEGSTVSAAATPAEPVAELDEAEIAAVVPPPPARGTVELTPIDTATEGPRAELQAMALDPRELVAGLLDRWERTLEQRIYAEQRQRFEAELTNRQARVKQLQLELEAVRAEHAAAIAEKERVLAEKIRELIDRERELDDVRHTQRRGWFFRR